MNLTEFSLACELLVLDLIDMHIAVEDMADAAEDIRMKADVASRIRMALAIARARGVTKPAQQGIGKA